MVKTFRDYDREKDLEEGKKEGEFNTVYKIIKTGMQAYQQPAASENGFVDFVKLIMALGVVAIHTQPLEFNIWLDCGIGLITRFCVPFFL